MSDQVFSPGPEENTVRTADGRVLPTPADWALLPPGDPGLTRRVKAAGEFWVVQERRGRKIFSSGVWAPTETIERVRRELESERSTDAYAKRRASEAKRRDKAQAEYVEDFTAAVFDFLSFDPCFETLARRMAAAVADHAAPVGSGTVARTRRIPIQQRAEAAVIAWMRHQTTGYDVMIIPRIRGQRREVRRRLAQASREVLDRYRNGSAIPSSCPLGRAIERLPSVELRVDPPGDPPREQ